VAAARDLHRGRRRAFTSSFALVFKSATKAGLFASLIVVGFFYYGLFSAGRWFVVLWLGVFVAAVVALARTRRDPGESHGDPRSRGRGSGVASHPQDLRLPGAPSVHLGLGPSTLADAPRQTGSGVQRTAAGYLRNHSRRLRARRCPEAVLSATTTRRSFRDLTKRGFLISQQARSPYSDSEMNIAAELNMDYLSRLPTILGPTSQDVRPVRRLIADNRASRLLKSLGYRYVHLDTDEVTYPAGNPHISPFATPDSFPSLWLRQTLLRLVGGRLGFNDTAGDERFRKTIRAGFSKLERVPRDAGPKFVVFHTLVPHDPYIFGAKGQSVTFPDRSDEALGSKLGMSYYLTQLQFLNRKLLEAVDAILAQSTTPPVIVIQSDEGFQASPDTFGEAAMQQVRIKGLIALHLPVSPARGSRGRRTPSTLCGSCSTATSAPATRCFEAPVIRSSICRISSRRCGLSDPPRRCEVEDPRT